jgi:hypothetical protein
LNELYSGGSDPRTKKRQERELQEDTEREEERKKKTAARPFLTTCSVICPPECTVNNKKKKKKTRRPASASCRVILSLHAGTLIEVCAGTSIGSRNFLLQRGGATNGVSPGAGRG